MLGSVGSVSFGWVWFLAKIRPAAPQMIRWLSQLSAPKHQPLST